MKLIYVLCYFIVIAIGCSQSALMITLSRLPKEKMCEMDINEPAAWIFSSLLGLAISILHIPLISKTELQIK